jgi:hypothetical protein
MRPSAPRLRRSSEEGSGTGTPEESGSNVSEFIPAPPYRYVVVRALVRGLQQKSMERLVAWI